MDNPIIAAVIRRVPRVTHSLRLEKYGDDGRAVRGVLVNAQLEDGSWFEVCRHNIGQGGEAQLDAWITDAEWWLQHRN